MSSPRHGTARVLAAAAALLLTVGAAGWTSVALRVADAESRVRAALDAGGLETVEFTMRGLDVEIETAPSEESLLEAARIIDGIDGLGRLDVDAVRLDPVAEAPAADEAPPAEPDPAQAPVPAQPVLFAPDSALVDEAGRATVLLVAEYLHANPGVRVTVIGHTAPLGDAETNGTLSHDRADAVASLLIEGGIAPERITAEGHGDTEPVTTDPRDPAYQSNRRADFVFVHEEEQG